MRTPKHESPLEKLCRRMRTDDTYLLRLLLTLQINRLEDQFQQENESAIFQKQLDDVGLIQSVTMHPKYHGKVPMPKIEFSNEDVGMLAEKFGTDKLFCQGIEVMLGMNQAEAAFPRQNDDDPPVIVKKFDAYGVPIAYALNSRFQVEFNMPVEQVARMLGLDPKTFRPK